MGPWLISGRYAEIPRRGLQPPTNGCSTMYHAISAHQRRYLMQSGLLPVHWDAPTSLWAYTSDQPLARDDKRTPLFPFSRLFFSPTCLAPALLDRCSSHSAANGASGAHSWGILKPKPEPGPYPRSISAVHITLHHCLLYIDTSTFCILSCLLCA